MDAPRSEAAGTLPHSPRPRQPLLRLALAAALLPACTTARTAPAAGPSPLERRLDEALAPLSAAGAVVSLLVRDGASGAVLAAARPGDLVLPASTQKLLTTAAVLRYLPGDHRFTTAVAGPEPTADGTLAGDLWIVGDGDPGLGSARGLPGAPASPGLSATLWEWAAAAKRAGVRRVSGSVVGDGRALPAPGLGAAWSWDDAAYSYSAAPAGLTLNESAVELHLADATGGVQALLAPATELLQVRVERVLSPEKPTLVLWPGTLPGEVLARWQGPPRSPPVKEWLAVPDPARFAAEQLTAALRAAGIEVAGKPRAARPDELALAAPRIYASSASLPLRQLCGLTNRDSLNLHAEVLLMQLGRLTGNAPTTLGGLAMVHEFLREAGADPAQVRIVDGSGLSRQNLLSARALVAALGLALARDPSFVELLPANGAEGTLRARLAGTAAAGRVHAKTGSMTGHRNLVGVIEARSGRRLHFALLLGGLVLPRPAVDAAVDAALLALVEH